MTLKKPADPSGKLNYLGICGFFLFRLRNQWPWLSNLRNQWLVLNSRPPSQTLLRSLDMRISTAVALLAAFAVVQPIHAQSKGKGKAAAAPAAAPAPAAAASLAGQWRGTFTTDVT